jgi:hypothetical protein
LPIRIDRNLARARTLRPRLTLLVNSPGDLVEDLWRRVVSTQLNGPALALRSHRVSSSKRGIPSPLAVVQPFLIMDLMFILTIGLPTVVAIAYCVHLLRAVEREH